jgi:hypothetical protein
MTTEQVNRRNEIQASWRKDVREHRAQLASTKQLDLLLRIIRASKGTKR